MHNTFIPLKTTLHMHVKFVLDILSIEMDSSSCQEIKLVLIFVCDTN